MIQCSCKWIVDRSLEKDPGRLKSSWNLQLQDYSKLLNTPEHALESVLLMLAPQEFSNIHRFESMVCIGSDEIYDTGNDFALGFEGSAPRPVGKSAH